MKKSVKKQLLTGLLLISLITISGILLRPINDYRFIALLLLLTVSVLAMTQDILPVLFAALLSAAMLNFFFIDPEFTFKIDNSESVLLVWVFLSIALVNAVLTYKIRQNEKKARDREEKEKTIQLYDSLLSSLSHELRTPVATIIGSVDTLREQSLSLSHESREHLLEETGVAALRLNDQIDSLLNMNRLETGSLKLHLDWWDINEIIFSAMRKSPPTGNAHVGNIMFLPDEHLPLFRIDGQLIEQAIVNLIKNARSHNPPEVYIEIRAELIQDQLRIGIADDGAGIPDGDKQRVFDKFYRLPEHKVGGLGLGLSIVKGFAEAHNGCVHISDRKERGVIFEIGLPAEISYVNKLNHE